MASSTIVDEWGKASASYVTNTEGVTRLSGGLLSPGAWSPNETLNGDSMQRKLDVLLENDEILSELASESNTPWVISSGDYTYNVTEVEVTLPGDMINGISISAASTGEDDSKSPELSEGSSINNWGEAEEVLVKYRDGSSDTFSWYSYKGYPSSVTYQWDYENLDDGELKFYTGSFTGGIAYSETAYIANMSAISESVMLPSPSGLTDYIESGKFLFSFHGMGFNSYLEEDSAGNLVSYYNTQLAWPYYNIRYYMGTYDLGANTCLNRVVNGHSCVSSITYMSGNLMDFNYNVLVDASAVSAGEIALVSEVQSEYYYYIDFLGYKPTGFICTNLVVDIDYYPI